MPRPVRFTPADFRRVRHLSPAEQAAALGCSIRTVQRHYASVRDRTPTTPTILDPASGGRMFYFRPDDERVIFGDIRREEHVLSDGRVLRVDPDVQLDFRALPYADESFRLVVFDPPHLLHAGGRSWMARKYGKLHRDTWRDDLRRGFRECFRVLADGGTLVLKWSEKDVKVSEVLALAAPHEPVIGHRTGKTAGTHWMLFVK